MAKNWPTLQEYNEAVQNPRTAFADAELQGAQAELTPLGLPRPITGGFASVYRMQSGSREWAVRCFYRGQADHARYVAIGDYLTQVRLPYAVSFSFLQQGIRVQGSWYPILKMEWLHGESLNVFVGKHLHDAAALQALAQRWAQLITTLISAGIAHGDLQHSNVMVINGELKLIDYDGMFVPSFRGKYGSHEVGHRNYQHPRRGLDDFDERLDAFSAWVIFLSLIALSKDPSLWQLAKGGDDYLLLRKEDFERPQTSAMLAVLQRHQDGQLAALARLFVSLLNHDPLAVPSFVQASSATAAHAAGAGPKPNADWLKDHMASGQAATKAVQSQTMKAPSWLQGSITTVATLAPASVSTSPQIPSAPTPVVTVAHGGGAVTNSGWILDFLAPPRTTLTITHTPVYLRVFFGSSLCGTVLATLWLDMVAHALAFTILIPSAALLLLTTNGALLALAYRLDPVATARRRALTQLREERAKGKRLALRTRQQETARSRTMAVERKKRNSMDAGRQAIEQEMLRAIQVIKKRFAPQLDPLQRGLTQLQLDRQQELDTAQKGVYASIAKVNAELTLLGQQEQNLISRKLEALRQQSIGTYLEQRNLGRIRVQDVPERSQMIVYQAGIRTAADVTHSKVIALPSIGDMRAYLLVTWASTVMAEAKAQTPSSLSRSDLDLIKLSYKHQEDQCRGTILREQQRLSSETGSIIGRYGYEVAQIERAISQIEVEMNKDIAHSEASVYQPKLAKVHGELADLDARTSAAMSVIDTKVSEVGNLLFEHTRRLGALERDCSTYKNVSRAMYARRAYFGR